MLRFTPVSMTATVGRFGSKGDPSCKTPPMFWPNRRSVFVEASAASVYSLIDSTYVPDAAASAVTDVSVVRVERQAMIRLLHERSIFSERFMAHLLARNVRIEEDLVDQLFNSTEKRLARGLLLLARFGKEGATEPMIPKISQEVLAEMVGTTRPRVNEFMNKFRKLGFIQYNGGLHIHSSLLNVLLHDKPPAA